MIVRHSGHLGRIRAQALLTSPFAWARRLRPLVDERGLLLSQGGNASFDKGRPPRSKSATTSCDDKVV